MVDSIDKMIGLLRKEDWGEVINELEEHGYLALSKLRDSKFLLGESKFLLEYVLEKNAPPLDLVQNLVNRNPFVLSTSPCVSAAIASCNANKINLDVVKFLLVQYPNALSVKIGGDLPLHAALTSYQGNLELIEELVEVYPSARMEKSAIGQYPIEVALLQALPGSLLNKLMISFSDTYDEMKFALDLVKASIKGNCSEEVVKTLITLSNNEDIDSWLRKDSFQRLLNRSVRNLPKYLTNFSPFEEF